MQLAATAAMHGRDSILLDFAAPDKAADKKAAPTWGKPGAGAAEVNNAQTQLKTNASHHFAITTSLLRGVSGAACLSRQCYIVVTSRHPHGSDRADATLSNALSRPMVPGYHQLRRGGRSNQLFFACFCRRPFRCPCGLRRERIAKQRRLSPNRQLVHSFAPYQFEMLPPQCRHDFNESSRWFASPGFAIVDLRGC
ncbi:MAG TPA: hypothetical protein VGI22_01285 [Xanthobacteraceae bacterium]